MDLEPGTVVANRYRISRPLGRGGMGEVFAAENIRTGRPVAIKLLRQDSKTKSTAVQRFRQEARAAGAINSDHVTQVLDVEEDPEHGVVLVFELLEGESLIDRLKRTGPIPFEELWPIIEQVWMGLADAHKAGIVHRDLKPSNVFLERRPDGTTRVKILDFGISKVPKEVGGETLTEMGQSLGTFSFMPPEQIGKAKHVDHRADIYACATLIYQSLSGQLPYSARNILVMVEMKSKTDARKLGDAMNGPVDPRLEEFVARGLARDAAQRFPTALDALSAWRDLRPTGIMPASSHPLPPSSHPPSSGTPTSRPRSQPPPAHGAPGPASSKLPRTPPAPVIIEAPGPLPRVNTDAVDTTDETAATLAMPVAHIKKGQPSQLTPQLNPRLESATASLGSTGTGQVSPAPPQIASPQTLLGPGGTQPVRVGRAFDHLSEPRSAEESSDDSRGGNLRAHPAGVYLPPSVAASLRRAGHEEGRPGHPVHDDPSRPPQPALDPTRGSSHNLGSGTNLPSPAAVGAAAGSPEPRGAFASDPGTGAPGVGRPPSGIMRTVPYQPTAGDTARRTLEPVPVVAPKKSSVPLVVVLVGFLLVGFVVVALVMTYATK